MRCWRNGEVTLRARWPTNFYIPSGNYQLPASNICLKQAEALLLRGRATVLRDMTRLALRRGYSLATQDRKLREAARAIDVTTLWHSCYPRIFHLRPACGARLTIYSRRNTMERVSETMLYRVSTGCARPRQTVNLIWIESRPMRHGHRSLNSWIWTKQ